MFIYKIYEHIHNPTQSLKTKKSLPVYTCI